MLKLVAILLVCQSFAFAKLSECGEKAVGIVEIYDRANLETDKSASASPARLQYLFWLAKNGNAESQNLLMELLGPHISRFAKMNFPRMDSHMREDLVQETLLDIHRAGYAYDPQRGAVTTWLNTYVLNRGRSMLRKKRALPTDPTLLAEVPDTPRQPTTETEAAESEGHWKRRVSNALGGMWSQLSPEHQRMLLEKDGQQLSFQEMANQRGAKPGQMQSRYNAARKRFTIDWTHPEVRARLSLLTDWQQKIVQRCLIEGATKLEASNEFSISVNSVSKHLMRAEEGMKSLLLEALPGF